MYRLLIVDDEIELIDGLKTIIDWESNGIDICGEADNGKTAWELIQRLSPDILLMDIRMPIMDGLEVLEKISQNNLPCKTIILSGYDDFYYAQKAIDLNAANYLLKPCKPEEILQCVLKTKAMLDEEHSKEMLLKNFRQQLHENLPALKEKLLREIIYGKADENKIQSKMDLYNIKFPTSNLITAVLHIDDINSLYAKYDDVDMEALKIAIVHMTNTIISDRFYHEVFQNQEDIIIILSPKTREHTIDIICDMLDVLRTKIKDALNITVTIGIGTMASHIGSLWQSYKDGVSAVESKFFLGCDRVISFIDITLSDNSHIAYPLSDELAIINCLRTGNDGTIKSKVENFYQRLGAPSKKSLQRATIALLGSIYKFCIDKNLDTTDLLGRGLTFFDDIQNCETNVQLQDKIVSILFEVLNKMDERENKNILVKSAVDYIKENYSQDINLECIAKKIFITPGYLSMLFKQEMGVNFLEFLHKYRIQKSRELLKNSLLKNYEISDMVGYKDEKYFSQIFKKYTGLTPTQYKESINIY